MLAPSRTKHRTEDRQAELVQAALQMAAQRSPSEITTGDLAQAIGITQGGVFKHFESKEAIWLAAIDWAHQTLLARVQEAASRPGAEGQPLQALREMFLAHVSFVQQYPGVPRLIFQELQHAHRSALKDKVQVLMSDYRQVLVRLLTRAQRDGQLSPQVDLASAAVLFLGAVQGLVMQSMMTGTLKNMPGHARSMFDLLEAGLRAPPKPLKGQPL